jgi:hypothetical protein
LPDRSGGKKALVQFYHYAKTNAKLISTLGGKTTILVFFLDKDVDDIRGCKCRSPHVIYSAYYDLENHLFRHGNLMRGVASAVFIDPIELAEHPRFAGDWCESAARRWKEWIVLCLFAAKRKLRGPYYRVCSQVNIPINGTVDANSFARAVDSARSQLGLTADQMNRALQSISRRVDSHLAEGTYDRVFKGKWYPTILEADIRTAFAGRELQFEGLCGRIVASLAATLDFSQEWANHFVEPLAALVERSLAPKAD